MKVSSTHADNNSYKICLQTRDLVRGVIERAQLLLSVTLVHEETTPLTSPVAKEVHDDALTVTSPSVAYARSFSAPPTNYEAPPIRYSLHIVM